MGTPIPWISKDHGTTEKRTNGTTKKRTNGKWNHRIHRITQKKERHGKRNGSGTTEYTELHGKRNGTENGTGNYGLCTSAKNVAGKQTLVFFDNRIDGSGREGAIANAVWVAVGFWNAP